MKHTHLVKNTALLFINKFSGALATFILLPVYTSHFSTESYGLMDLIVGYIILIAPIVSLRLDMGIFKHLIDVRGDREGIRAIINSSLRLMVTLSILFIIIAAIVGLFVQIPFYWLVIIAILSNVFFATMSQITRGLGMTKDFVMISIIVTVVSFLVSIIGILILHINTEIMLIALIVSQSLGTVLLAMKTELHTLIQRQSVSRKIQKQILVYSYPLVADGASFWIMNTSSRTVIVIVLGAAANGTYAVASKFAMIIEQFIGVFFQAFIETATLYAKKSNKSELYSDVMNKYLRLFWSGCILLIAAMPFIFPVLVRGDEFSSAALFVPVIIVAVMARAVQNFLAAVYQANGYTKQIATTTIIGAAINLMLSVGLVFFIGIWAAAIASLVSYIILSTYRYFDIRKYNIRLNLDVRLLLLFVILSALTLSLYYVGYAWSNILNLAIVGPAILIINWGLIRKVVSRRGVRGIFT